VKSNLVIEIVEPLLIVICMYFVFYFYDRCYKAIWPKSLIKWRLTAHLLLLLTAFILKICENVLEGKSVSIDTGILVLIHRYVPSSFRWFFETITFTGSAMFLFPFVSLIVIILTAKKYRFESMLIATSTISGVIVTYLIKMLVNRPRPALWDTVWYWGSSFPSGHTLAVTAFSSSVLLSVMKISPDWQKPVLVITIAWITLMAISRLVLGVHWPSDVLISVLIGVFIPLVIGDLLKLFMIHFLKLVGD